MKRLVLAAGILALDTETEAVAAEGVSNLAVLGIYADIAGAAYSIMLILLRLESDRLSASVKTSHNLAENG